MDKQFIKKNGERINVRKKRGKFLFVDDDRILYRAPLQGKSDFRDKPIS